MERKPREQIDFKYNLSLYFKFLKNYKGLVFILLVLILIVEASYVLDKFLFKVIVDKGTEFAAGSILAEALISILIVVAIIYLSAIILRSILKFFHIHLVNKLDAGMIADVKRKFFNHLVSLDHNFHTTNKTGSLISRLVRSGGAIERMTDVIIFNFAPLIFQLVVVSVSLLYFSWIPALVTFVTIITFISYSFIVQKSQEKANIEAINAEDREKGNVSDFFTNIDSIKYFGKEKSIKSRFKKLSETSKNAMIRHWDYFRWLDSVQSLIIAIGIFLLIYFPLKSFLAGEMTLGTIVFIYTVFVTLMGPLWGFVHGIRNFYRSMADFEVLFQYAKIENEIKDKSDAKTLKIKKGEIELKNINFNYGKRKLFENFSLKVPENKKIALVGHSGCGKTSLIKLLYRFYDVQEGEILIDGINIKDFKQESLRNEMSIVPQECVLFDDSIYNNVAFSNPRASRDEVLKAIKFAQLDKIIENFPDKERTIVGERGVRLSGGEKQRVSIARAILANKKVLVLDEATSSLDSETEFEIQRDLEKLMKGRTSIIIAHRLSTIMKADIIVVMQKGKIVQKGTHRQLINQQGQYKRLWNLQKGGYIK